MMASGSFADENLPSRIASSRYETSANETSIRLGAAVFHSDDRHLSGPAGETRLEPRVAQLLTCLARHRGAVVTRANLLGEIWPNVVVGDDSLNRLTARLRRAFAEVGAGSELVIETIPKSGYRLTHATPKQGRLAPGGEISRRHALAIAGAGCIGLVGLAVPLARGGRASKREGARAAIATMNSAWESYDHVQINGARAVLSEQLIAYPEDRELAGALAVASVEALLACPRTERELDLLNADLERSLAVATSRERDIAQALLAWRGDEWAAIDRALVQAPESSHTLAARIRLLDSVGRTAEASTLARTLYNEQPTSLRRLAILLSMTLRHGNLVQVESLLADALRYYDQHPSIWRSHFVSLALAGRFREAREIFLARGIAVAERAFPPSALTAWELTLATLAEPDAASRQSAIDAVMAAPLQFQSATPESMIQLSLLQEERRQINLALAYYTGDERMVRPTRARAHYPLLALNFGALWDRALLPVRRADAFSRIASATGLHRYWRDTGRLPDDRLAFQPLD